MHNLIPQTIENWIDGRQQPAETGNELDKYNPSTGELLCRLVRSESGEITRAIEAAARAQPAWADTAPVQRGMRLLDLAMAMKAQREDIARIVTLETGKSFKEALGETDGAIDLGVFYASEGQRLYGRTTTSGVRNKYAMTVRQPVGIAGLIIAANTPIANVAWKIFPALVCGNTVVLKAAEDTPATAWMVGKIAAGIDFPRGVLNIVQGLGEEAGAPLAAHPEVGVVSFTGSAAVGRQIAVVAGERLAKVSLELGGKNPLVVCDDADLDRAVNWTALSAFSNAGQRCAAAGRVIVFDSVYERFRNKLINLTSRLRVGPEDDDDFGPVINARQLERLVGYVERARDAGAVVLTGGERLTGEAHRNGFYMSPTIIEGCDPQAEISRTELFGPVCCLYRASNFADALSLANDSPYGLTACIHTTNFNRAWEFCQKVRSGVAVVNAGTYGSEPHMPFGGMNQSGNGSREPGTEALSVYSELKDIYLNVDSSKL